ncbi:MAG: hypothetical protein ACRDL5_01315 [Solirubrobacteraceae bacterium]
MWRRQLTRKRLLQAIGLLIAIGIAFVLSLGNFELATTVATTGTSPATTSSTTTHTSTSSPSTSP